MTRIVVSPKAITLARTLYYLTLDIRPDVDGLCHVAVPNPELMTSTGLIRDTLFRAITELHDLDLIRHYSKPQDGVRRFAVDPGHWLFVSLVQRELVTAGGVR